MPSRMRIVGALAIGLAVVTGTGCGPQSTVQVDADVRVTGAETLEGKATFQVPARPGLDCVTYARRGLHEGQRFLQLLFMPAEVTEDAPLQQLAVSLSGYNGPGQYRLGASNLAVTVRAHRLRSVDEGAELVMRQDASGSIRASGRLASGDAMAVAVEFRCFDR